MATQIRSISDAIAISTSTLCAVHCFGLPLALVFAPGNPIEAIQDESVHFWFMIIVLITSPYALASGGTLHKKHSVTIAGFIGVILIACGAILGHEILGAGYEKALTLSGAAIIAIAHFYNYKLCDSKSSE